jgi:hypothetical protein
VKDWTYVFEKAVTEDIALVLTLAKEAKLETIPFRIINPPFP